MRVCKYILYTHTMSVRYRLMTQIAVSSRAMARPPNKPRKGEAFRLNLVLPGDLVASVDEFARKMASADQYGRDVTRTDAFKILLVDALQHRAKK